MNIRRFSIPEMFSNSQGKTSIYLMCSFILVGTGCVMGLRGAFVPHGDSMLQGLAFATLGAGMLTTRRFTPDKPIAQGAEPKTDEKPD